MSKENTKQKIISHESTTAIDSKLVEAVKSSSAVRKILKNDELTKQQRLKALRDAISEGRYNIDASLVAKAILSAEDK